MMIFKFDGFEVIGNTNNEYGELEISVFKNGNLIGGFNLNSVLIERAIEETEKEAVTQELFCLFNRNNIFSMSIPVIVHRTAERLFG